MDDWKKTAAKNIRKLTPGEALAALARMNAEGSTIFHKDVRDLTGGYNSQSINFHVIRKLAIKAGIIKAKR